MKADENVEKVERYTPIEKCRAVWMVWTEQRKASALCRELKINPSVFSQWQDRAISGMLGALETRSAREGTDGPALSATLKRLLDRKLRDREVFSLGRLTLSRRKTAEKAPAQNAQSPASS
jgi:transposase-like protein